MDLESKHKFNHGFVCINCGLETDPFITWLISYEKIKRLKQNDKAAIRDLTDLILSPDET